MVALRRLNFDKVVSVFHFLELDLYGKYVLASGLGEFFFFFPFFLLALFIWIVLPIILLPVLFLNMFNSSVLEKESAIQTLIVLH